MEHQQKYVALYERLNHDDEQLGESNSISHQKEMLEEYARNHGITNYRHFQHLPDLHQGHEPYGP